MTDPSFIPEEDRELLVVYPTFEQASRARDAVIEAGIPESEVHLDRASDMVVALRAQMHSELMGGLVVHHAGVIHPKEGGLGALLFSLMGVAIGAMAAFPLALIPVGSTTYLGRLAAFALVGAAFGATLGLLVGSASSAQRRDSALAAGGTLLRVERDSTDLRRALANLDPVRIEEVAHDDQPIDTLNTSGGDDHPHHHLRRHHHSDS